MLTLPSLTEADAGAGGKAFGLARVAAAGAPVPPGFVLPAAAFVAAVGPVDDSLPLEARGAALAHLASAAETADAPELAAAIVARARALGPRVIVRSSLALEDRAAGAAPGVGASVVVPAAEVWAAVRAVWASALTPLVAAYAHARPGAPVAPPTAIVQRFEPGFRATIYTRPPGHPDGADAWIACGPGAPTVVARDGAAWREALDLASIAEAAIGAPCGADVELVWAFAASAWVVVQARPLIHPPPPRRRAPAPPLYAAALAADGRPWRRDVTHNPAPLSVAQAELCARVEAAAIAPFHLRVVAQHLYWAPRADAPPPPPITDAAALAADLADDEAAVAAALTGPTDGLADAVERYLAAYRVLAGRLGPRIAAGKTAATAALTAAGLTPAQILARVPRPSAISARLAAAARGEIAPAALAVELADVASAWDVAAPTLAETPARLREAIARAALRPGTPPPAGPGLTDLTTGEVAAAVDLARVAFDAGERDDLWYWRAQAVVRRALLGVAAERGLAPDDVWWLPWSELADDALTPDVARGRAAAARAAAERAAAWDLPLAVGVAPSPPRWHGAGVGGRAVGPAYHTDGGVAVPPGAIAVARAITPALVLALDGAAALIGEHGTPLDHGPAMARELGIPCVVGCDGAFDAIAPGQWLAVDGDRGEIRPYTSSSSSSS